MAKKKSSKLSTTDRLEFIKEMGKGLVELAKSGPVPRYTITSLGLYALGRSCMFPCGLIGAIQGINTVIAVSEVTEDTGPFSGVTNGLLSSGSGVAAGVLMNDLLADKCGCPRITPKEPALPDITDPDFWIDLSEGIVTELGSTPPSLEDLGIDVPYFTPYELEKEWG